MVQMFFAQLTAGCRRYVGTNWQIRLTLFTLAPSSEYHSARAPFTHPSPHPKRQSDRFSCFCTAHVRKSLYFTTGCHFPPLKSPLPMRDLEHHPIRGSLGTPQSLT